VAETSIITPGMQAAIGSSGESNTITVEPGAVMRFAEAISDLNPAYPDIAPPTFLRSAGLAIPPLPEADSVPRALDGASEWVYTAAVMAGDQITVATTLESLKERQGKMGAMLICVFLTTYINQNEVTVATQRNTVIRMRATE
jgi:hypothetical protein